MRTRTVIALLVFSFFSFAAPAQESKPASDAQEAAVVERLLTRVHYDNDGTGVQQTTSSVRIQSEAAVQAYGQLIFGYSSETEKIDVDYVRVTKPDGKVIETPAANQQDFAPEIFRTAPMYGDYRQRHVTVVGLRPGDLLEYQTTTHIHTPLAQGQFWYEYSFPKYRAITEAKLEIEIPKSRAVHLKSPKRQYDVTESGDWRTYTWTVRNIKPDRGDSLDEDDPDETEDEFPEVQLSSFTDWKQVAEWYGKLQSERVSLDPTIKKKAAELTAGATTPLAKARRIYDYVARDFRYVSLSFGVGRFQPHAASEVLAAGYGDCKDKHTLLQALLRAAGIESYPVLIGAGRKLDPDVPSPAQFNHVITAAKLGTGFTWLDSTSEVAPFGHLLYDLRNQQALLTSTDANAGLHKTPADSPVKNTMLYEIDGTISENGAFDGTIAITATGDSDFPLRSTLRQISQADWQRVAKSMSLNPNANIDVKDISVLNAEDTSKPIVLKYKIHQDAYFHVPSANESFMPFPPIRVRRVPKKPKNNDPLKIGPVGQTIHRARLQFSSNFTLTPPTQMALTRDYADFSTTFQITNNLLVAEQKLIIKANEIPPTRRNDYDSFQGVSTNYPYQTISLSIRPGSGTAVAASIPSDQTPDQLHRMGSKALERREFQTAAAALKQLVEKDPNYADAWDELGRAYVGLNQRTEAIAAFNKQVQIDKYHKRAFNDLAQELQAAARDDEAVAAYRQQLENVPLDRVAQKNLGLLLLKLKRDGEALTELEKAAGVPPADYEVNLALAQLYQRAGKTDRARSLLTSIVGNTSPFPGGDIYAAALRDDIDPDATIRDARKIIDDIGDQFDSGSYSDETIGSAMQFISIAWARIGWAKCLQGSTLEGLRYLESGWVLSQPSTVANRMARIYAKAGQKSNALRYYALSVAAGGPEAESSKAELQRLDPVNADKLIAKAQSEITQSRIIKFANATKTAGTAEYVLLFDGMDTPDHLTLQKSTADWSKLEKTLSASSYPVMFPDVSSIKLVRHGALNCSATDCSLTLQPISVDPALISGF